MDEKNKRKPLSKKIRFEVFKRDKFQCQYCGKIAPDVILHVDHIKPVAKGGDNNMCNLITSCIDCNQGKRDRLLSDDSIVVKQRKQLELLQERKEQLELLMEWKNSLLDCEDSEVEKITEYLNKQIYPYSINNSYKGKLKQMLKKHGFNNVISAVDKSTSNYLRYDKAGLLTKESVELSLDKIGGIATLQNKSGVDIKIGYIKGICRNKFNAFSLKTTSVLLKDYVSALYKKNWSDEDIVNDLEEEVIPFTRECCNLREWTERIEEWINDINNWE